MASLTSELQTPEYTGWIIVSGGYTIYGPMAQLSPVNAVLRGKSFEASVPFNIHSLYEVWHLRSENVCD